MTPKTWEEVVRAGAVAWVGGEAAFSRLSPEFQNTVLTDADDTLRGVVAAGLAIVPREAADELLRLLARADASLTDTARARTAWSAALSAGELAPPDKGEG